MTLALARQAGGIDARTAAQPSGSCRPTVMARSCARCARRPRQELAVTLRDPHLRLAHRALHGAVLAADRERRPPGHAPARRRVHRRLGHLRHGSRDRRHGDPLVAVRQRARVHRREHRRRRRADARVDPRPRDLASARAAREAHRRERLEPVAHPRRSGRRAAGGAPRRGRRAARHGRDQRPGDRS